MTDVLTSSEPNRLLTRKSAEVTLLQGQLEALEAEHLAAAQQQIFLQSFLQEALHSWSWWVGGPARWLKRQVRPRGFQAGHLLPWQHLEVDEDGPPGSWRVTGGDPQFIVPCYLPAGWLRVRVDMTCEPRGRQELYASPSGGFAQDHLLERTHVQSQWSDDFYVHLPQSVLAFRFDPIDREGLIHIRSFRVDPVPPAQALLDALRTKLRLLWQFGLLGRSAWNGLKMLWQGRVGDAYEKLFNGLNGPTIRPGDIYDSKEAYRTWRKQRQLTESDRAALRREAAAMTDPPRISVLMPVSNIDERYLRAAIESVLRQTYSHWELCLANDASSSRAVSETLRAYAARDPRIKVVFRPERGGISRASNSALDLATGTYIALLDHDDELAEQALSLVARAIAADRDVDFLYSDEDKILPDGTYANPFFKPDWSPEYFLSCMYTCHLGVYRTELVRELGGFRPEFDFAQDYDLALRIVARTQRITHIPDVLYHWRMLPSSTAVSHKSKPLAHERARAALEAHLRDIGLEGTVEPASELGFHRVCAKIQGQPRISIIIPTACKQTIINGRETTFLQACLASIREKSSYRNIEIVVIDNGDMPAELQHKLAALGVQKMSFTGPLNLAAKLNLGVDQATGDHLVLLNDDVTVLSPDWLECLLEYSQQSEIGAVGAKLLFPSGRLQHVGVTIPGGLPGHPFYNHVAKNRGYFCGNIVARNYSAVTGACLMTRAELYRSLGGFDEAFPLHYNDVDYCLRVRERGLRIVFTPYAQLHHHEAASKPGSHPAERVLFQEKWGHKYGPDPYYNPNLTTTSCDYRLATDAADT